MRHMFGAAGLMMAGFLCACTGAAPRSADGPQAATVVRMGFHSFEPAQTTIAVGQTVEWANDSMLWHTVTCDPALAKRPEDAALPPGAARFDSGKVDAGHRFSHTFTVPGTYRYFCQPHELNGMVGEVKVTGAGGGAEK
jgi:plastocyanin